MFVSFLFWNIDKRPRKARIAALAAEYDLDVLMLAECAIPPQEVLQALNGAGRGPYCFPFSEARKIHIFTRFQPGELVAVWDSIDHVVTVRRLLAGNRPDVLLAVVHYHDRRNWTEADQMAEVPKLARVVAERGRDFGHQRTILVGDFNMDPFDKGVVMASGLHAVMTRDVAGKRRRVVAGESYPYFYNPMWGFFGDRAEGPPGTHYFLGKQVAYFWHIFDQVLLRPDLMNSLKDLRILDAEGPTPLLTRGGRPDRSAGSDHLPLYFRLEL
jgi:endonuclease/exonuclease/phosphatase family metal-dependent hydrolase